MRGPYSGNRRKWSGVGRDLFAYGLLFGMTVFLQWWNGAYTSEFGNHPDEAAHYVTGLMLHDFCWQGDWFHPRAFAEQYYIHYPKVAIGHWPPFFYILQAAWTSFFPLGRSSMILFMAVLTTTLAATVYRQGQRAHGWWGGLGLGVLLLLSPPVQRSSSELMADILMASLALQATLAFGRFLEQDRWQDACAFGIWSSLAIMTKQASLVLALLPLPAMFFCRRFRLVGSWKFWLPAVIVTVLCAPWCVLTLNMARNGLLENIPIWNYSLKFAQSYAMSGVNALGIGLLGLSLVGLFAKCIVPWWRGEASGQWSAFGGYLIAFFIFFCLIPNAPELRYSLLVLPVLVLAVGAGVSAIASRFTQGALATRWKLVAFALIGLLFFADTRAFNNLMPTYGYSQVADEILSAPCERNLVLLVSSDSIGDGMCISEIALRDRRRAHVVLRASKILSSSNWLGYGFTQQFANPEEVTRYLKQVPIDFIVLDTSLPPKMQTPDHLQLAAALESHAEDFQLVGVFPLVRRNKVISDGIHLYRSRSADIPSGRIIRVPMDGMLGKTLELNLPSS